MPSVSLVKKKFLGKYAISAEEFSEEMVNKTIILRYINRLLFELRLCRISCCYSFSHYLWPWASFTIHCQVGAKSRNVAYLKGKVPSWVGVPTSVAIPFGTFEKVLSDEINKVGNFFVNIKYWQELVIVWWACLFFKITYTYKIKNKCTVWYSQPKFFLCFYQTTFSAFQRSLLYAKPR